MLNLGFHKSINMTTTKVGEKKEEKHEYNKSWRKKREKSYVAELDLIDGYFYIIYFMQMYTTLYTFV